MSVVSPQHLLSSAELEKRNRRRRSPPLGGLLLCAIAACYRPADDARARGSWSYEVEAPNDGSRTLTVEATFDGAHTERIMLPRSSQAYVDDVRVKSSRFGVDDWRTVKLATGPEGGWVEPSCDRHCTIRYKVDLGALAVGCEDEVDCARRVGPATLSPALAWLAHPSPRTDVPVFVRVKSTDPSQFATGMRSADESPPHSSSSASMTSYSFRSFDLDEGSFSAFGPMRRERVRVGRSTIDIAILGKGEKGGDPSAPNSAGAYSMTDEDVREWVGEASGVIASLFGRFPVDRATIFLVPAKGDDEVVFGKVLSLAGSSVVLVVGDKMQKSARHKDWVLVHELFHLGFPTFRGEGRWLGEGLATYYEPILRARSGWITEAEVFRQFARNMPRGQPTRSASDTGGTPAGKGAGLASRDDLDSVYWGGALFCLAADVRIREETRGQKSLDDVLRALLARGGDATRVWTLHDVVRLGDLATGTTIFSDMHARYAENGERIDMDGLFASLGIIGRGTAAPDDSRRLAWIRRMIVGPNTGDREEAATFAAARQN